MRWPRSQFLSLSTVALCAFGVLAAQSSATAQDSSSVAARLRTDVAALTRYPTRIPGSAGNLAAARYMESRFKQIGLQRVRLDGYKVTAPVTKTASLTFGGRKLGIYPIYPNHVVPSNTPRGGLTGPVIYAGQGNPQNYNGMAINGAIVVLDFNSGMNWITAADLGAAAILFLEPTSTDRGQAERKYTNLPVEVPRYYVREGAAELRQAKGASGTLVSRVVWEHVNANNVLAYLPGTNPPIGKDAKDIKKNTVIISGYFDSMSVVPDLAPGAEAAGNAAALLEVARRLKAKPPTYNVLFMANGAHHLALAGARQFVARHIVDGDGKADEAKLAQMASYRCFVGLDLTSRTSTIGLFAKSSFYNQMNVGSESLLLNQFAPFAKALGRYAEEQARLRKIKSEQFFVDGVTGKDGRTWRSYLPSPVAMDSEVATMAALPGVSFATANDARLMQDTPFDTADRLNFDMLARGTETTGDLVVKSLAEIAAGDAGRSVMPTSATLSRNFGFTVGRAIYRDVLKATSFLPDTPLPDEQLLAQNFGDSTDEAENADKLAKYEGAMAVGAAVSPRGGNPQELKAYSGVRGTIIERAIYSKGNKEVNPVTQFVFVGPRVGDPKGGGTPPQEFEAYSINRDGFLTFAPDLGAERQRFSPMFNKTAGTISYKNEDLAQLNSDVSLICFECRASTIFDTLDQRYFTVLKEMTVLNARTDANPVEYGFLKPSAAAGTAEIEPIAIVFCKPGESFKLIMAAGLLGKRLILLNTYKPEGNNAEIAYEGIGFTLKDGPVPNRVTKIAYQTARDLWILDQQRIRLLKGFGINNERVDKLHAAAGCADEGCPKESLAEPNGGSLLLAEVALADQKYDVFYREARRAFGLESRAYPDVEATSQDVLKGIIFYLALLLPFSYFMERMLFGFPDVRKQIAGTSIVFLGVFGAIRYVHPAFELALTPFIILLAFVILALTVVVTIFLQSKFEQEIKRLKQGVHFADVGRLSALGAALGLGIANMRRRPTRTALTCVTLILLTFTVLSFTSVTANIANFARKYGDKTPAYQGFLIRQPDWSAMTEVAVSSLRNEILAKDALSKAAGGKGFGEPALRAWYLSRDQGEPLQLRVNSATNPDKFYYAPALVGMTPQEKTIGSPVADTVIAGRWFEEGDEDVALLPLDVLLSDAERSAKKRAASGDAVQQATPTPIPTPDADGNLPPGRDTGPPLGLTLANAVGSQVQVAGKMLRVIGVFDDSKWYSNQADLNLRDLDNEEFSPVDYSSDVTKQNTQANSQASQGGDEVQVQKYEHMPANALLLLPYQTTLNMGGTTRSVAVHIEDPEEAQAELDDLMQRAALGVFGATPDAAEGGKLVSKLYSSVEATSYEGFAALAIPVLIAALIIANTMLGSVYERTREIGIYSSIGLAPIHVAALFIAEAAVYAVLGSISGYLIAQITAKIITATGLLPGITLNYSSSSAVLSTLIVMATVLLSTLYPAWAASKLSQPDERNAELGEPVGDLWRLKFPFTVSGLQSLGMGQFLADFFETHTDTSVGKFYTDKVHFSALTLREAVELLNEGVLPVTALTAEEQAKTDAARDAKQDLIRKLTFRKPKPRKPSIVLTPKGGIIDLAGIGSNPETEVYRLSMRTWLAPFDMGVSQDTDIILLPSNEPGLYEMQLRLDRKSGEIAAWKRVNREFMTDLRKQLLLWRVIKPEGQQEYILKGRAHIAGQAAPHEAPGAVVS